MRTIKRFFFKKLAGNFKVNEVNTDIENLNKKLAELYNKNTTLDKALNALSNDLEIQSKGISTEKKLRLISNRAKISSAIDDSIFIFTIPKSGTTYTINFLANYICNIKEEKPVSIAFENLVENGVFHTFDTPLLNYNVNDTQLYEKSVKSISTKNSTIARKTQYSHILGTHKYHSSYLFDKAILLYRNPLDFLVSIYNFEYVKRGISTPFEQVVKEKLSGNEFSYIERFKLQLKLSKEYGAHHVSYEDLILYPKLTFTNMLNYLEIPVDEKLLNLSMEMSSIKNVIEQESKSGKILLGSERGLQGSFITSGKIGQWTEYFDDELFSYVKKTLEDNDISLNLFQYEN